jgi:hypothetical protein
MKTLLNIQASPTEISVIERIVAISDGSDIDYLNKILLNVFGENIRPYHYIVLGFLIGERVTTEKMRLDNYNQLQLCQRQN